MMRRLLILILATQLSGCFLSNLFKSDDPHPPTPLGPITTKLDVKQVWNLNIGDAGRYYFSPTVHEMDTYVAANDGTVARLNTLTGAVAWKQNVGSNLSAGVGADAATLAVATTDGELVVLEIDGKTRWKASVGGEVLSPPAVGEGLVVARTSDGRFIGFDGATGKRKWAYQRPPQTLILRSAPGIVIDSGNLYAGLPGGRLIDLALTNGGLRWESAVAIPKGTTELERVADVMGSPVIAGRQVCVATFQGRAGCFELTKGAAVWTRDVSTPSGIAVDLHNAYLCDEKSTVEAMSRLGGGGVWKDDKLQYRALTTPAVLKDSVAVADFEGFVHWLATDDGSIVARAPTDGSPVRVAPVVARVGNQELLLVQTSKGGIYAFSTP
ncbi:MAG: outer membrane protein assembly factor BamB [Burkholderiaceae bacterium]|jgi:outer membrane protein assembly factor BamB